MTLFIPQSHSLKDKRMVVRGVKDRVRQTFNVAIAEVEDNDLWQRAVLGLATVGNDRRFVDGVLDELIGFVRGMVEISNSEREVQSFNDALAENDLGFRIS